MSAPKRDLTFVYAALAIGVLMLLPVTLTAPLRLLNTHLHEMCHALAALITGGKPNQIVIYADGSGVTESYGGWPFFILQAGYLGSTVVGVILILAARSATNSRRALVVLGVSLGVGLLLWVRGQSAGIAAGVLFVASLVAASRIKSPVAVRWICACVGLLQVLSSLRAVADLIYVTKERSGESDATLLASMTHIPAMVWCLFWAVASVGVVVVALRAALKAPVESH